MRLRFTGCLVLLGALHGVAHAGAVSRSIYDLPTTWRDETGSQVTFGQWRGHRVALTMSYTSCRSTCPFMTMKTLRKLEDRVRDEPEPMEFLVVTLDPKTDTPAVLAAYKQDEGITSPHWHFLTGSIDDTETLARRLGIAFTKPENHIFHSFKIAIVAADGRIERALDWDHHDVDDVPLLGRR